VSGFNQVVLVGRIGQELDLKYTQGGTAVLRISLATSRRVKDEAGEYQEKTSWHTVKAFGRQAEVIAKHCGKGDGLFLEGRLDYWEAEGKRGKLMVAEIILEHFEFGSRAGGGAGQRQQDEQPRRDHGRGAPPPQDDLPAFEDDDLPF
jgi:single-strand DNA-binding protein